MNDKDRAILYGMAIGDGSISFRERLKDGKYPYVESSLSIAHGPKQKEYLEYKRDLIHSIMGGVKLSIRKNTHNIKDKVYNTYAFSKTNKYFRQMHRVLYSNNKKKYITKQVLDYLDERSLALWYMDDGCMFSNKNKQGEETSIGFSISTQCTLEEANLIKNWLLDRFNITVKVALCKGKYDIRASTKSSLLLASLVEKYLVPCMMYKVGPAFRFVFRKSAKHPNFNPLGEDIVRPIEKEKSIEV